MADPIIDLANRALNSAGGRATIASLSEGSNEANCAQRYYNSAFTFVLTRGRWNFAQRISAGVQIGGSPLLPRQWTYAYSLPADSLRIKSIEPVAAAGGGVPIFGSALAAMQCSPNSSVPFALGNIAGNRAIMCRLPAININYTAVIADLTQWEPQALIALEMVLASKMAIPLSGDKTLARGLYDQAEAAMQMAIMSDANEDISRQDLPVDWLSSRDGGWCQFDPFSLNNN